ncbi:hypothetical protein Q4S45_03265 [Massilia sp. R2A-15]|uniref:hypothetical protein n=1 Tax=Massilia sp. R2A-15 TaxID=3064278 RepID=UPI002733B624|nr:hypothetical protein [Massilia sp. R2A-15]WLI90157.1 hypothetical protein Q4S45_03265 [Massilia sp. R2A-15]
MLNVENSSHFKSDATKIKAMDGADVRIGPGQAALRRSHHAGIGRMAILITIGAGLRKFLVTDFFSRLSICE